MPTEGGFNPAMMMGMGMGGEGMPSMPGMDYGDQSFISDHSDDDNQQAPGAKG